MELESLTFRTARKHLQNLQAEADVMLAHREAMECHDCEALVQLGIDAFDWVMRADSDIRQSLADTLDSPAAQQILTVLLNDHIRDFCEHWSKIAHSMLRWISIQEERGYEVQGSALYRSYAEQMQLIVADYAADDRRELPASFATLQDQALREYRQGETSEFLSEAE